MFFSGTDNSPEDIKSYNLSDVALEYFLCLDRKPKSRLHSLIPVQPFAVDATGRVPECDICLCEFILFCLKLQN